MVHSARRTHLVVSSEGRVLLFKRCISRSSQPTTTLSILPHTYTQRGVARQKRVAATGPSSVGSRSCAVYIAMISVCAKHDTQQRVCTARAPYPWLQRPNVRSPGHSSCTSPKGRSFPCAHTECYEMQYLTRVQQRGPTPLFRLDNLLQVHYATKCFIQALQPTVHIQYPHTPTTWQDVPAWPGHDLPARWTARMTHSDFA